ncbi:hypothetical protein FOPE_10828 [Fonsecaea pedrosoi]|nr:hypothetical protein FOPE_10828 [Fonsecaea pedrosoi]
MAPSRIDQSSGTSPPPQSQASPWTKPMQWVVVLAVLSLVIVQKTERPRRSQNPPGERPPLPVPLDLVGARGEPRTEAAPSEVAEVEEEEEEGRVTGMLTDITE